MNVITFPILLCLLLSSTAVNAETRSNALGMKFVKIPAGQFMMGSPVTEPDRGDDEHLHEVEISRDFYLQTTEVTRKQWKQMMGDDPSSFQQSGDQCPVHRLKWEWVMKFIEKLNAQDAENSYRLPTEAEWEYAARAGTQTHYAFGNCLGPQHAALDFRDTSPLCRKGDPATAPVPVASFQANPWGLYDMHGNVWEMCSDWYGEYPGAKVKDPTGPASGEYRVIRGASWKYPAVFARSANRKQAVKDVAGFRLVMVPTKH